MSWIEENTTVWRRGSLRRLRLIALVLALAASSTGCSTLWRLSPLFPPRAHTVSLSDLDGDGDLDAVVGNGPDNVDYPGEPNRVWLNDGAGRFRDSGQRLVSTGASGWEVTHAVALGDIDGDGDTDAVFGDALFGDVPSSDTVWVNDGDGRFVARRLEGHPGEAAWSSAAGDLDALIAGRRQAVIWWNDGQAAFTRSGQRFRYSKRHGIAIGDFNGDGRLDVFAGRYSENLRVWFNQGDGTFRFTPF